MVTDEELTMQYLDDQRTALLKSPMPRAERERLLELNSFTRALLEAAGAKSVAELVRLIPGLAQKGKNTNANSN